MRVIRLIEILLDYVLLLVFAAALVAGVFRWQWFIASGAALGLHFLWELLRLRCPWCGSTVETGVLLRGLRRPCHCPSCGHEITVVWHVNRSVPEHAGRNGKGPSAPAGAPEGESGKEPVSGVK